MDLMHAALTAKGMESLGYYRDSWLMTHALILGRFDEVPTWTAALDGYPVEALLPHAFAALGRGDLEYLRGDWAASRAAWEEARATMPALMAPYLSYAHLTAGVEELRDEWEHWRTEVEPQLPEWTRPPSITMVAESLRRLGEGDAAAACVVEFAGHSGYFFTNTTCWFHGPWDTALGVLSLTAGELDQAVDYLTRAVEQCDAIQSPSWGVVARVELGTAARVRGASGDDALATETIAAARRMAEELGMPGWIERLDRLDAGDLEPWNPEP